MAKHVCNECFKKINSDEALELHMIRHELQRLIEAINFLLELKQLEKP